MKPSSTRYCIISTLGPRRLPKPTFPQRPSSRIRPESLPQSVPEHSPSFRSKYPDCIFFQQVHKMVAAWQAFDEICHRPHQPVLNLAINEAHRTREYRQQCAWNGWKMNWVDLLEMEETRLRQTEPEIRGLKRSIILFEP